VEGNIGKKRLFTKLIMGNYNDFMGEVFQKCSYNALYSLFFIILYYGAMLCGHVTVTDECRLYNL
jgi:hypothetical protein